MARRARTQKRHHIRDLLRVRQPARRRVTHNGFFGLGLLLQEGVQRGCGDERRRDCVDADAVGGVFYC